jgi:hypothetical protein
LQELSDKRLQKLLAEPTQKLSRLSRNGVAGKLESPETLGFLELAGAFQSFPAQKRAGKLESPKKSQ